MKLSYKLAFSLFTTIAITAALPIAAAHSAAKPIKKKPTPINTTKGQKQMPGADGEFGTVYSMKNGFNEELLSARYTVQPVYAGSRAAVPFEQQKLLVVNFAIKNAMNEDQLYNYDDMLTAVDQGNATYSLTAVHLASDGTDDVYHTLRPGQGLGQQPQTNPYVVAYVLPLNVRIVKLILNTGRLNTREDVVRYYIAGATAAEAGKPGNPKNIIAPLPDNVRDTSDPTGATALGIGRAPAVGSGQVVPTNDFDVSLDSVADAPASFQYRGAGPSDGQKFVFATITVHNDTKAMQYASSATGTAISHITDTDGEDYELKAAIKHASPDEVDSDKQIAPGDSYTARLLYQLPTTATPKTLDYNATNGRVWRWVLTGADG